MAEKIDQDVVFFYYPDVTKKNKNRLTLAGLVKGNQIHVGQAICFKGKTGLLRFTHTGAIVDIQSPVAPDKFDKKEGRRIALDNARNGKTIMTIDIPENSEVSTGKLFVTEVEKRFPRVPKQPVQTF